MKIINLIQNKKRLLLIGFPMGIILLYSLLLLISPNSDDLKHKTPTTGATIAPTAFINKQPIPKGQTNPPVKYNKVSSEKMINRLKNRIPLSTIDEQTKQRITASINDKSSVLRETSTFRVEYISSPDIFMVEIRTTDIGKGKSDAKAWFTQQGFTPQGACELPVVYYLSSDAASQLRNLGISFNPLAEGC